MREKIDLFSHISNHLKMIFIMKKIYQLILIITLSIGLTPLIYSCADSDDPINEWDMSYVTLLPADYLTTIPTYTLKHVEDEDIEGNLEFQFVAAVNKVSKQDIKVYFDYECDKFSVEKIEATAETAIIKAGSKVSDTITIRVTNWDELEDIKEAVECALKIRLRDIETTDKDVRNSVYYQDITLNIVKKPENLKESVILNNAKDWDFTFMEGVENPESNSVAGTGTNIVRSSVPLWFTIDIKSVKTLTAILTLHGIGTSPTKVEVLQSDNGKDWISIGQFDTGGSFMPLIEFNKRIKTRYLKYQMIEAPNPCIISKIYLYALE